MRSVREDRWAHILLLGTSLKSISNTLESPTSPWSALLARDQVQIGLAENGGDSTQDGCAFHVIDLESLFAEFKANGLDKELSEFDIEQPDDVEGVLRRRSPWSLLLVR